MGISTSLDTNGESSVKTTCAYCGVGCGIIATRTGERSATISGDKAHPANHGRLCSKGTHLGETIGLEGRLLYPELNGQRTDWDNALSYVAERFKATIAQHGPESVAFYVSGQLLTEDYYVANKLMKGFIGTANIDTNSRLCMASAVAAHNRAFGEDVVPCSYTDLDEADLIILLGSNTAWCHPVIWQRIEAAREARGTKIVVIDPRRTETAERADLHLAIAPDSDVALFNGLLLEMRARFLLDGAYMANSVSTPDGFWQDLGACRCRQGLRHLCPRNSKPFTTCSPTTRAASPCSAKAQTSRSRAPTKATRSSISTSPPAALASPARGHSASPASPTPWAGAKLAGWRRCLPRIWALARLNAIRRNGFGNRR